MAWRRGASRTVSDAVRRPALSVVRSVTAPSPRVPSSFANPSTLCQLAAMKGSPLTAGVLARLTSHPAGSVRAFSQGAGNFQFTNYLRSTLEGHKQPEARRAGLAGPGHFESSNIPLNFKEGYKNSMAGRVGFPGASNSQNPTFAGFAGRFQPANFPPNIKEGFGQPMAGRVGFPGASDSQNPNLAGFAGASNSQVPNYIRDISEPFRQSPEKIKIDLVHISMTRKKTFVTITDFKGNKKTGASAGCLEQRKGRSRYSGEAVAEHVGRSARKMGVSAVVVKVKGTIFFKRKRKAILSWSSGFRDDRVREHSPVLYVHDVTQLPHNGCRLPKQRRT